MSVYITGCEKDKNILPETQNDKISTRSVTNEQPTQEDISDAKNLFYSQINNLSTVNDSGPLLHIWKEIIPVWDESKVVIFNSKRLIATPTINGMNKSNLQLMYFKNNDNEKFISIFGIFEKTSGQTYDNFSGKIVEVGTDGYVAIGTEFKNGKAIGMFRSKKTENSIEYRSEATWQDICNILQCELRGPACECVYNIIQTDHGVPQGTIENSTCPWGEQTGWMEMFYCDGDDCTSWNSDNPIDGSDGSGTGLEDTGFHPNTNTGGGGNNTGGGGNNSATDLDNGITNLISTLLDGVNSSYKPCNKEKEFDGYQPFAVITMDYDDYLNLNADAIFAMWGNNSGIALVNAILSSNGNLANALYTQVNPNNNFEYDEDNPVHQAVLKAVQALIKNINNANGDCNSIMKMSDFVNLLNGYLDDEKSKLSKKLNENLDISCDIKDIYDSEAQETILNLLKKNKLKDECLFPGKTTKDILSDIANDACGKTKKTNDEFWDDLTNKMFGPKLDWTEASDQEKIDKFLRAFRITNIASKCGGKESEISLNELFYNVPTGGNWSSTDIVAGKCIDKQDNEEFDITINIHFPQFGDNQCLYSYPPAATGIGGTPTNNPRVLDDNSYAYDYCRCQLYPSEYFDNIPPAMEIVVPYHFHEIWEYYYVYVFDLQPCK